MRRSQKSGDLIIDGGNGLILGARYTGAKLKPSGGDFAVGPRGGDVGPGAEDVVVVICQDGEGTDVDGKNPSQELHSVDNPCFAMRKILVGNGVISVEERPTDTTAVTMVDSFLILLDISTSR
jgi:hypothetical protein